MEMTVNFGGGEEESHFLSAILLIIISFHTLDPYGMSLANITCAYLGLTECQATPTVYTAIANEVVAIIVQSDF